jgi:hypothetical protein
MDEDAACVLDPPVHAIRGLEHTVVYPGQKTKDLSGGTRTGASRWLIQARVQASRRPDSSVARTGRTMLSSGIAAPGCRLPGRTSIRIDLSSLLHARPSSLLEYGPGYRKPAV